MKNLVWLIVAAVIALGGYMLFTGKGPQEVATEASDAINAPAVADDVSKAAKEAGEAITEAADAASEAVSEVVDEATESANEGAAEATEAEKTE